MYSVLFIDDEQALLEIGQIYLNRTGYLRIVPVLSAEKALELLSTMKFDAIVSDYMMPKMDGITFLKKIRSEDNNTPFILFTGRGREDIVIEALNCGADFYLQKGGDTISQYAELAHMIKVAIERAESEKNLIESGQKFKSFFANSLMGNGILDQDGVLIEVNDRLCTMLGYLREELTGKRWINIINTDIPKSSDLYSCNILYQAESKATRNDDTLIDIRFAINHIQNKDNSSLFSLLVDDITSEKKIEEIKRDNEQRMKALFDLFQIRDLTEEEIIRSILGKMTTLTKSKKSALLFCEPDGTFEKIYSIQTQEGKKIIPLPLSDEDISSLYFSALQGDSHVYIDNNDRILHKDIRSAEKKQGISVPIIIKNRLVLIIFIGERESPYTEQDIHEISILTHAFWENLTKIRMESGLQDQYKDLYETWNMSVENANSIRTLLDALDDICILINPDGTIIDLNRRAVEKFKMSNISVKSNIYSLLPGNSQELLKESIRSALITGSDQDVTIDLEMQSYNWIIHPIKGIKEKYTRIIIFCRDPTSIGETSESSEHYDENYRQITEFLHQSVFEIDRSGIIRYLNSHALNLLKISSDDIRSGLHYEDFVSESNIDQIRSYFSELMEGKEVHIIEAELQRKDGKTFLAIIQAFPVLEMRSVGGVRGILIDLNEMQNQEDPRKELENKYRIIIENSKEIIIVSQNGKIQFLNPLGLKITGYGLNELIGRPFIQFIHPEDRDLVWDHYRKRLSGDNPDEDYVFRFIDRKGEIHWVKTNAILIDWEGKPATLNMLSEITELINTQEALAASENLLSGILDFLPDPFFAVNMDGKVIFWNREAERLFGKNAESMIGKSKEEVARVLYGEEHTLLIDLLLHPDELISEENSYLSVGSDIAIGDVFLPSLNGRPVYLWGKATYLYNKEQKITGIIESIRDITQRKEMENNLKLLNQKLSLFTSITRHDIRNQLMMILILVDQIMQTNSEPYITHRITQIDKIISRINDFITRAQEYQEIGMSDPFWKPVLQIFFDAARDAHISTSITEYAPECGDISIYADPLLEKAFFNIIDNSFKYATGFTKISFGCKITDTGLILSIEDDGPGIPYDDKEAVFSKGFGQGTGLGLFLVREILLNAGMEIHETGTPGKGARFEICVSKERFRIDKKE